ncbi:MAG TPA: ABC transporter ATP-binding protein, partial [Longimicrobium sp.]|nr:ABC transporter ATP-binding protein [Longimicrobium sp.]
RALLRLLWTAGRWRVALLGILVLATGLLPTAIILLTGVLAAAIPGAVDAGPGATPAFLALAGVAAALALLSLASTLLGQLCRVLDAAYAMEVHCAVAGVTLGSPGLAPLEDPALADRLQAVHDAEQRGVLRRTCSELATLAVTRLRGAGAFAVLLGFHWWAPLALAAAWHLTNRVYLKTTEKGVTVDMGDGAARMRRTGYLRSLALDAPAAKEVRVFGLGDWAVGKYGDAWLEALGALWRNRRANRALNGAAVLALALSHAAVLGVLGVAASRGQVGVPALLVFVQAVLATSDLGLIGDPQWWLAQSLAVAERVAGLRAGAPVAASAEPAGPAPRPGKLAVRLDGVRFTYRGRTRPVLDGLTLEVPAGQSLAIVGENGAGKSTLIKLLCGLYEPDGGQIRYDGVHSPLQARSRIGVIFQDFVRYKLPLRENVGFGNLALLRDEAALDAALRDAGGGDLLQALPAGWETVLSREFEGGADLSGGQWQRIALARALAAIRGGAGLLILDEPTAALDVRAEADLFRRFLELTRGVTTILVTHRLSSVRHVDRIVVVEGGRVVEDGTHESLTRAGGAYARMFALQAGRFAAGREEVAHA